jgi:OTU domain-containing protein 6
MEELQKRHRLERQGLESRILQKKRSATKKTRKGIHDECATWERQLLEKQEVELLALKDGSPPSVQDEDSIFDQPTEANLRKPLSEDDKSIGSISSTHNAAAVERARKPNRQKARLARRAAEQEASVREAEKEAQDLPNHREKEREAMRKAFISRNLKEKEIRSDGHCLYAAVADQLKLRDIDLKPSIQDIDADWDSHGPGGDYKIMRQVAAYFIRNNPDDFQPFLEQPIDEYTRNIRDTGEWGGHLELMALAKAYSVNINVLQGDGEVEMIEGSSDNCERQLWLAYYRHNFGLGEHYNSLHHAAP